MCSQLICTYIYLSSIKLLITLSLQHFFRFSGQFGDTYLYLVERGTVLGRRESVLPTNITLSTDHFSNTVSTALTILPKCLPNYCIHNTYVFRGIIWSQFYHTVLYSLWCSCQKHLWQPHIQSPSILSMICPGSLAWYGQRLHWQGKPVLLCPEQILTPSHQVQMLPALTQDTQVFQRQQ